MILNKRTQKYFPISHPSSAFVRSTANEFIIIAFCYERAGLVAMCMRLDLIWM